VQRGLAGCGEGPGQRPINDLERENMFGETQFAAASPAMGRAEIETRCIETANTNWFSDVSSLGPGPERAGADACKASAYRGIFGKPEAGFGGSGLFRGSAEQARIFGRLPGRIPRSRQITASNG